ncbi:MAG: helix-turn-helix transcriptional regulator [Phycisphaeraceae bacterium]|nr:helix-turn-helix transcriptional regulator [Phycisphaeraceae bacterium]
MIHNPLAGSPPTQVMCPSRFSPLDTRTDVVAAARDDHHRLLWCNKAYAITIGAEPESLKGSDIRSLFGTAFADERAELIAPTIETGTVVNYEQLVRGSRYLTRIFPLDTKAFGQRGYFVLAEPCTNASPLGEGHDLLSTLHGDLGELGSLTRRELEVFRLLAEGLTGVEIAGILHRSPKTVEFHTARILHTLSLRSRTELARMAAERGLLGFTREAWFRLAHGCAPKPRKAPLSTRNGAE